MIDFDNKIRQLVRFADSFRPGLADTSKLDLKVEHSIKVFENAKDILEKEPGTFAGVEQPTLLAALFHDLGRFPQYARFGTFQDANSVDHAKLGSAVLGGPPEFLRELNPEHQRLVRTAVVVHNKFTIPQSLAPNALAAARLVRDADKIDIIRVMLEHFNRPGDADPVVMLHVADEPGRYSKKIYDVVREGGQGGYADLVYVNDFKMLLMGWTHLLHYKASRELVRERRLVEALCDSLPKLPEMRRLTNSILDRLNG